MDNKVYYICNTEYKTCNSNIIILYLMFITILCCNFYNNLELFLFPYLIIVKIIVEISLSTYRYLKCSSVSSTNNTFSLLKLSRQKTSSSHFERKGDQARRDFCHLGAQKFYSYQVGDPRKSWKNAFIFCTLFQKIVIGISIRFSSGHQKWSRNKCSKSRASYR